MLYSTFGLVILWLVGKNPEKELIELCNSKKNIVVTGMVDNVFSYIKIKYSKYYKFIMGQN